MRQPIGPALAILVAACTVDTPQPSPAAPPEPLAPAPTAEGTPASAPAEAGRGSPPDVTVQELAQRLRQVGAILASMKEKAREAAAAEQSECAKSFASVTAAIDVSERATTALGLTPPSWTIAPRAEYLRLCRSLPPAVQRCSRYDYRADHADECAPIMDGLDGATAAVVEQLYHRDDP